MTDIIEDIKNNDKYILQFGSLAGWPFRIAQELRRRGINSKNYVYFGNKEVEDLNRKLKFDDALFQKDDFIIKKAFNLLKFIYDAPKDVGLVHYHGSNIFFRELHHFYEGKLFAKHNIPMLMTFGGGDARFLHMAREKNKYFRKDTHFFRDTRIKLRYKSWSKHLKFAATDPEMEIYARPYFDKIFDFKPPIDLNLIKCIPPSVDNKTPVILHIPTEPYIKGTDYIEKAVENLKKKGLNFEFRYIRGLTQEQMYKEIEKSDIYVDDIKGGMYSVTALENMAAGKPVLCYIREDLIEKFDGLPIVSTNPDNIEKKLEELILDSQLRNKLGIEGRKYIEKHHALEVVVDNLLDIYNEISKY